MRPTADELRRMGFGCAHERDLVEARAEIERLQVAVRWALGEAPDADGRWFGELQEDERRKPYWWRTHLRKIAGMGDLVYDKERRTIVSGLEQKATTKEGQDGQVG